ncbi:MAG: hypothetical protein P1V97_06180, partial [Planctomycetota bacterium]|nr:hypothetical protein [Planctomycetota bacterium]
MTSSEQASPEQPGDTPQPLPQSDEAMPPSADAPQTPQPTPASPQQASSPQAELPEQAEAEEVGFFRRQINRFVNWPFNARDDVEERWGNITQEWDRIRGGTIARYLFLTKIVLLHARYIFGYIAAGFLVSAPLYMGTKLFNDFSWDSRIFGHIFYSLLDGLICLIPFVVLIPFTQIDWENMRVPEFKIFELALTRWASYIALAYLIVCINLSIFYDMKGEAWWFDLQIAWINFTLMVSAWLRIKIQTLIFKDFYSLESKEDLVLHRKFEDKKKAEDETQATSTVPDILDQSHLQ